MATHLKSLFSVCALLICWGSQLHTVESANILVYCAIGSHSLRISMTPMMEALTDKGHNVTFLTSVHNIDDPEKKSKVKYYTPEKWKNAMGAWEDNFSFFQIRKMAITPELWLGAVHDLGIMACEVLYSDPEFVNFVKTSKFDLVIVESAVNECGYGLAHYFNAKLAMYGTATMFPWFPDPYGFPDETSTVPHVVYNFPPGDRMTFVQRVKNALTPIVFNIKREYAYFPVLEEITRKGLGLGDDYDLPSFVEIEKNTSLVLQTSHFTTDVVRSFPPHVIPIGGAAVGHKKQKPLPKDMEEFINSAKSGFIFIGFGTIAEFTNFEREVQLEFIQALETFSDMKFLWALPIGINETLPKNVMSTKWVPQQTILAHPNLKAFITHCGMGSITESVRFGVPLVMLPIQAEQDVNANAIETKGAGIKLEVTTLTKHELEHALSEILNNPKYRKAMKQLSEAFMDRPMQPVETTVWWIEYILRHPNSNDYLVPLSVRQPWWKRRQIDVWLALGACLLVVLVISIAVVYFILKSILLMLFVSNLDKAVKAEKRNKLMKKKQK